MESGNNGCIISFDTAEDGIKALWQFMTHPALQEQKMVQKACVLKPNNFNSFDEFSELLNTRIGFDFALGAKVNDNVFVMAVPTAGTRPYSKTPLPHLLVTTIGQFADAMLFNNIIRELIKNVNACVYAADATSPV